jgi:integrase-like protein
MGSSGPGRVRVERGIYRQPNRKYAVCWRHAGRLRFRTVGFDLAAARLERLALIAATREGKVPVSPRLRFETAAGRWLERFEAKVAAGVDFAAGVIHVRAQLSRAHRGAPAKRVAPKTPASVRDIPLVAQLARLLSAHGHQSRFARGEDWVFATARGTPYGHRNVSRRALGRAAQLAGLNDDGWPPLRFHDLRHTFASHLIIDLGLDPAQVSRILGHPRVTITLDIYTHLFEDPATRTTSEPAWPPARSPAYSSPPHPPPAPPYSSSDSRKKRNHGRARTRRTSRGGSRQLGPSRRPHCWKEAQLNTATERLVLVQPRSATNARVRSCDCLTAIARQRLVAAARRAIAGRSMHGRAGPRKRARDLRGSRG